MFKPVSSKLDVAAMEAEVLKFWKKEEVFKNQSMKEYEFDFLQYQKLSDIEKNILDKF